MEDTVHIKFSGTPDDAPAVNLRTGWTPRILGAVLVLFVGWFVVSHADDFLPALGSNPCEVRQTLEAIGRQCDAAREAEAADGSAAD